MPLNNDFTLNMFMQSSEIFKVEEVDFLWRLIWGGEGRWRICRGFLSF